MGIECAFVADQLFSFTIPFLPFLDEVTVLTFGFILSLAYIASFFLLDYEMKRKKINQVDPATVVLLALVFGVAGSRVGMIITEDMWTEDLTIDSIIGGQRGYQWGIVFGSAAIAIWTRWYGIRLTAMIDAMASGLPLGLGVGKLACFFSGDGCYGLPTDLPWGMSFPNGGVPTKEFVHPVPLYESLISFLVMGYILMRRNAMKHELDSGCVCIFGLCLQRFLVEFVRQHEVVWLGLTNYQLGALWGCIGAVVLYAATKKYNIAPNPEYRQGMEKKEN